jgi:hypothetical protein
LIHQGKTISAIKPFNIVWKRISLKPYESFPRRLHDILLNGSIRARLLGTIENIPQLPTPNPTETPIESTRKQLELDNLKLQSHTTQTKRKRKYTEDAETSEDDERWKGKRRRSGGTVERPIPYQKRYKAKFEKISTADSEYSSEETAEIKGPVSGRTRSKQSKFQANSAREKTSSKNMKMK